MKQVTIQIGENVKEAFTLMLNETEIKAMLDSINVSLRNKNVAESKNIEIKAPNEMEIRLANALAEVKEIIDGKTKAYSFKEAFAII